MDQVSPLDSIKLIKDWWSACETHTTCCRTLSGYRTVDSDRTPLPRRCIRVNTSLDNAAELDLTLEETKGKHGRYICLSHRWIQPDTEMSSTTASNYAARTSGTGFWDLPPSFLQAFRTAAGFGIQYIWIDSLCIIQDAPSDWEEESAEMGEYYQLAAFTIVSTLCPDDSYSEYSPPRPQHLVRLPYRDEAGMRRGYFYVYPRRSASGLEMKFTKHIRASQILTRGWVFQEWLLSRRIICFTQSGVYTQCLCRNDTVRNQLGEDIGLNFRNRRQAAVVLSIKSSLHLELQTTENIYCGWEAVVEQYSSLAFSYPEKDRIIALLGVAREFAATLSQVPCREGPEVAEDGFITGLWKDDLHRGLLWEQVKPGIHNRLANLPTWSWASINSAVRWRSCQWVYRDNGDVLPDSQEWSRSVWKNELTFVACTVTGSYRLRALHSPPVRSHSNGALFETSQQGDQGILHLGGGGDMEPNSNFDGLHLRGRLQPVNIGDYLCSKVSSPAADLDGFDEEEPGLSGLRIVATAGLRDVISGWASLEHSEFQQDCAFTSCPLIFALLVSTLPIKRRSCTKTNSAYANGPGEFNVLYLRRSETILDGFERLGVGRLFGHEAGKGFQLARERDVKLL